MALFRSFNLCHWHTECSPSTIRVGLLLYNFLINVALEALSWLNLYLLYHSIFPPTSLCLCGLSIWTMCKRVNTISPTIQTSGSLRERRFEPLQTPLLSSDRLGTFRVPTVPTPISRPWSTSATLTRRQLAAMSGSLHIARSLTSRSVGWLCGVTLTRPVPSFILFFHHHNCWYPF